MSTRRSLGFIGFLALLTVGGTIYYFIYIDKPEMTIAPSASLNPFRPDPASLQSVPIVFTSRTNAASLTPESPESEPYREPIDIPWAATEGRLRLIDTKGKLFELTHGRTLPDGASIIDVMSPSVSLDGTRILFAGRTDKLPRWRIYQVQVDGSALSQLTGGPEDPGCIAIPPLRLHADGTKISDQERLKTDYDDIDPTDLGINGLAFASSRLPDLGRDHSRRATQIWTWDPDNKAPEPVTANRNNDRWPVLINGDQILFSLWTRNREAIAADLSEVRPVSAGGDFATRPTNNWMAAIIMCNAAQFGYAIKSVEPVWRPRPLFNSRIVYMTRTTEKGPLRLAQADWGYIRTAPSSISAGEELPYEGGAQRHFLNLDLDTQGRELAPATPSAAPNETVLFSAVPSGGNDTQYAIYAVSDSWTTGKLKPQMIFDDPNFVDAEPVAVYHRQFIPEVRRLKPPTVGSYDRPKHLTLASGEKYSGPMGYLENIAMSTAIRNPIPWHDRTDGKPVDPRKNPLVSPPPNVTSVAVYSAGRDRFDDPEKNRVEGTWEKRLVHPLPSKDDFSAWVPSDPLKPSVLVGLDAEGKVAKWDGVATGDRPARTYFAYAGDHYSGVRPNSYNYCNGCHTGHTFIVVDPKERTGESWNNLLPK